MSMVHARTSSGTPSKERRTAATQDDRLASSELVEELTRLEKEEQVERDRQREEERARLRDLARFD